MFVLIIRIENNSRLQPIIEGKSRQVLSIIFEVHSREGINNSVYSFVLLHIELSSFIEFRSHATKMVSSISIWLFPDQSGVKMTPLQVNMICIISHSFPW